MIWIFPTIIALIVSVFKDIFKKKLLVKIEPVQFVLMFYFSMFLLAQTTLSQVSIPNKEQFVIILLAAFCYCVANLTGLRVLKEISISVFKPVYAFSSVFVLFFAFIFLKETINLVKGLGVILVIIPIFYLVVREFKFKELDKKHVGLMFIGMTFEAFATIFDRIALKTLNTFTYFYFLKLVLIIMLFIAMTRLYKINIDFNFFKINFAKISFLAVFTMIGAYAYFFALADPLANTGVVKIILASSLIFGTFLGGLYFKDDHLLLKVGVSLLTLIGIFLLALG